MFFSSNAAETWLIAGLGNPGREYEKTRHNTGFRAMDILAEKLNAKVDGLKFQGLYTQVNYNGKKLFLNLVGRAEPKYILINSFITPFKSPKVMSLSTSSPSIW